MQCFVCGELMRVVMVEPHAVAMQGFELRTFQCIGCGDVEKRPVFDSAQSVRPPVHVPEAAAPPPPQVLSPRGSTPGDRVKSILGGLVRLRGGTPHP